MVRAECADGLDGQEVKSRLGSSELHTERRWEDCLCAEHWWLVLVVGFEGIILWRGDWCSPFILTHTLPWLITTFRLLMALPAAPSSSLGCDCNHCPRGFVRCYAFDSPSHKDRLTLLGHLGCLRKLACCVFVKVPWVKTWGYSVAFGWPKWQSLDVPFSL